MVARLPKGYISASAKTAAVTPLRQHRHPISATIALGQGWTGRGHGGHEPHDGAFSALGSIISESETEILPLGVSEAELLSVIAALNERDDIAVFSSNSRCRRCPRASITP
ncbi:hypothetical protein IVA95_11335 [Bradyrhizobium sp. 157]|uniref:hypothetical protein n=1 Tax=Bradyrhizobium sp. 157 TaxID=2782631 RepID=UPI001FFB9962|nr:hypothetical protein [Bradyrhizobium sp. 157]MCK1638175.1 hypothetical protein [Bradyrhizobium sp. 157]